MGIHAFSNAYHGIVRYVMSRFIYGRKGVTPIELLLATAIVLLAVGSVTAIYIMSTTVWKEGSAQIALQREASIVMEKMLRGINGMNGIREADTVLLPNANNIRYTSGVDSKERSFYLSSGQIMYDPNTSVASNEFSIAGKVRTSPPGLIFTLNANENVVTISLGMEDRVRDRVINADLTSQVRLRN